MWRYLGSYLTLRRPPSLRGHLTYIETREALKGKVSATYICTIRNPWARMASYYRFIKTRPPSDHGFRDLHIRLNDALTFEGFVDHVDSLKERATMLRPQGDYLIDENGDVAVDHILKLENLQEELAPLLKGWELVGTPPVPRLNVTSDPHVEPESAINPTTHEVTSASFKTSSAQPYDYRSLYPNTDIKNKVADFDQFIIDNFNYKF